MSAAEDLLAMFSTMKTTDHSTLVSQFMQVCPGVAAEQASFCLEASNWSLQVAVGFFYDQTGMRGQMQAVQAQPMAELVHDVTIGDGEAVPPGTQFTKTWRLKNSGAAPWPDTAVLVHTQGERFGCPAFVSVPSLQPGEVRDVSVTLRAPRDCGHKYGVFRLRTEHQYFSEEIYAMLEISQGGMLGIHQKMHGTSINPGSVPAGGMASGFPPQGGGQQMGFGGSPMGGGGGGGFGAQPMAVGAPGGFGGGAPGFGGGGGGVTFGQQPMAQPVGPAGHFSIPNFGAMGGGFGQPPTSAKDDGGMMEP